MRILFFAILILSLYSCKGSSPKPDPLTPIFDPTSPGGDPGGINRLPNVLSLTSTLDSTTNNVTLKWLIPSTYFAQTYEIYIYRVDGDGISTPLPDPSEPYSSSFYYYPTSSFTPISSEIYLNSSIPVIGRYTDSTSLIIGQQYTYYVYIKNNGNWSGKAKVSLTVGSAPTPIGLPTASGFWPSYTQTIGIPLAPGQTIVSSNSLSPGLADFSHPTGGCALAESGGMMYCADTANNRVVVYQTNAFQICRNLKEPTTMDLYNLCLSINQGYPFLAMAVLGQKDMYSNYPCGHPSQTLGSDSCFTHPSSVMVADGRLFVSDSGNNRVMIHSTLPTNGCFHVSELNPGTTVIHQCSFSGVIGKKSLNDQSSYNVDIDGTSSLKNPTGLAYKPGANALEGDLYIADTGNHRLVTARKVLKNNFWKCSDSTWKTSLCSFSGLLGQENYTSNKSFANEYSLGNYSYDSFNKDIRVKNPNGDIVSDNGFFLSHYFANPTRIAFNGNNLLIASNENLVDTQSNPSVQMKSRIVVFKNDPLAGISPMCDGSDFVNKCGYDYAIGQTKSSELINVNLSIEEYKDNRYSLTDADFTLNGNTIFGIDRVLNRVYVWADYTNHIADMGVPYDFYASNPMGAIDNVNSRILPNLQNLNDIIFDPDGGFLYVQDSQLGHIFQIPLSK